MNKRTLIQIILASSVTGIGIILFLLYYFLNNQFPNILIVWIALGLLLLIFIASLLLIFSQKEQINQGLAFDMQTLSIHTEKMKLLIEMSEMIQACVTIDEMIKPIAAKAERILHFADGVLYVNKTGQKNLESIVEWGAPVEHEKIITSDQCWALRKGSIYQVKNPKIDPICEHLMGHAVCYWCLPLMAQNTLFGLLHLEFPENFSLSDYNKNLISFIAETLSLALANITLRETLRSQSIHDSLTGLYNRRYLEEFLNKEINLARRHHKQIAVIMLDIDFFKNFNDKYGHEAGDFVLQELGKFFQNEVRSSDMTARYGGEEFIWVLYDCDLIHAKKFAEQLRVKVADIAVMYKNTKLEGITISLGVSLFPNDGDVAPELITAADKALYQAKRTHRNKVVVYGEMQS